MIPDYQRPYSWDKKEMEEYIDDMLNAYRHQHAECFLSSFILIEEDKDRGFDPRPQTRNNLSSNAGIFV